MPDTILNVPLSWEKPGVYFQLSYAAGEASGATGELPIILIGNKLSSGSASTDTVIGPIRTQAIANAQAGQGSELARQYMQVLSKNRVTPVYMIAVPEASGAKATGTITVTGTATNPGTVRIRCLDLEFSIGFEATDGYGDVAELIEAAINQRIDLPFTASHSVNGEITLQARHFGVRGNFLRYSAEVLESGTGISVTPVAHTAMTGGTGSDDNTAALAAIASSFFAYQVSAANDATQLGALLEQVDSAANATGNRLQRVIAAHVGTNSAAITLATGENQLRGGLPWSPNSNLPPCELAAYLAGIVAAEETNLGNGAKGRNFCDYGTRPGNLWDLRAPFDGSKPEDGEINAAIINGVTPIAVLPNGKTCISRLVTMYSQSAGENDRRVRDWQVVSVGDKLTRDAKAKLALTSTDKLFGADPPRGQSAAKDVVTPEAINNMLGQLVTEYIQKSLLSEGTIEASLTAAPDRIHVDFDFKVTPIGAQILLEMAETTRA